MGIGNNTSIPDACFCVIDGDAVLRSGADCTGFESIEGTTGYETAPMTALSSPIWNPGGLWAVWRYSLRGDSGR